MMAASTDALEKKRIDNGFTSALTQNKPTNIFDRMVKNVKYRTIVNGTETTRFCKMR